jgi:HPt (histidine-containing phosphotransfer) domain-containing protein
MAGPKIAKPDTVTYGDHEMITPDTAKLRRTLRPALPGERDPIEAAEEALKAISGDFSSWMTDECERLDAARRKVRGMGLFKETRQELFLAAHDLKGDSGTLGYPEVAPAADSLCRLLEHAPDLDKIPMAIVDQHVDAIRAIVREHSRADIGAIANALTGKLRSVTDEFLVRENKDRPDVLKLIQAPSIAAGDAF